MEDKLNIKLIDTPIGKMQAIASSKGLCALEFMKPDRQKLLDRRLEKFFKRKELSVSENVYIQQIDSWMALYFAGRFDQLFTIKLDLRGTDFELRVWHALLQIPIGQTISYSELAKRVGIPSAPRAAGGASRRNPMSVFVPCHRVIGMRGDLTGYGGGIAQKRLLIEHENFFLEKLSTNQSKEQLMHLINKDVIKPISFIEQQTLHLAGQNASTLV